MTDIRELYAKGLSCRSIAAALECNEETVRKRLIALGVPRRPKSFKRPKPIPHWSVYFARRVKPAGDCLLWTGSRDEAGYGRCNVSFAPGIFFTHRLSWLLAKGPFDTSLRILHRCDTPSCVNPKHLWLGTQRQNIDDMLSKGRQRAGGQKGEEHPHAVLTAKAVKEMRSLRRASGMPYHALAAKFGVSTMTALRACKGESWGHV